ncbi:MAG TPA: hypothetical protein VJR70_10565 [Stellaceae bacterium]|nr:hypothetical protein [Stellaceae bacterium]
MARYEAGETLASIARTYDCSPPAISYVVSRSRTRQPAPPAPPAAVTGEAHAQLIKHGAAAEAGANGGAPPALSAAANGQSAAISASRPPEHSERQEELRLLRPANGGSGNGAPGSGADERNFGFRGLPPRAAAPAPRPFAGPAATPADGDSRRTLHLALGQDQRGNGAHHGEPRPHTAAPAADATARHEPPTPERRNDGERFDVQPPVPRQPENGGGAGSRNAAGGAFIDRDLRTRVETDITAFLAAFDAALSADTQQSRSALREATDRLLRAGARTRIELERLEARVPLQARDHGGRGEPAWRPR